MSRLKAAAPQRRVRARWELLVLLVILAVGEGVVAPAVLRAGPPAKRRGERSQVRLVQADNEPAGQPATVKVANQDGTPRDIRLQFQAIPYAEALQRFAQAVGKPLVGEVTIPGALTFSSEREYSYGEALDAINVLLSAKNFVLVDTGEYLQLVAQDDVLKTAVRTVRDLERVEGIREEEMVSYVLPLQFLDAATAARTVSALVTPPGTVTPLAKTNSVLITDRLKTVRRIAEILREMDIQPLKAEIQVFRLKNAEARKMADVLAQLFGLSPAGAARPRGAAAAAPSVDFPVEYTLVPPHASGPGASATIGWADRSALTVTVDLRTNSLLIGGTSHYVNLAAGIIRELDADPAQERITRVYHLRNVRAVEIATAVQSFLDAEQQKVLAALTADRLGAPDQILEREVAVIAEPASNTLLVSASPRYFPTVAGIIEELDLPPPQVLVQVLLAELQLTNDLELGFQFGYMDVGSTVLDVGTNFGLAALTDGFTASLSGGDIDLVLRALQTQGRLEVLSRPQILASDNQEGEVNVGQRVPFITNSRVTEQGSLFNTIQYEQVGIILKVTPRITPDGFVKMDVAPEISTIADSTVQVSEGVNAIVVNNRSANTSVTVKDGHTIIIGGLITSLEQEQDNRIPFFGDLPLVNRLFRSTDSRTEKSELLIILTPHIMWNSQRADSITAREVDGSRTLTPEAEHRHGWLSRELRAARTQDEFRKAAWRDLPSGWERSNYGMTPDLPAEIRVAPHGSPTELHGSPAELHHSPAELHHSPAELYKELYQQLPQEVPQRFETVPTPEPEPDVAPEPQSDVAPQPPRLKLGRGPAFGPKIVRREPEQGETELR